MSIYSPGSEVCVVLALHSFPKANCFTSHHLEKPFFLTFGYFPRTLDNANFFRGLHFELSGINHIY